MIQLCTIIFGRTYDFVYSRNKAQFQEFFWKTQNLINQATSSSSVLTQLMFAVVCVMD